MVLEVPDEEAKHYAEGVRRGGTLLAVTAANYLADQAEDVLLLHGAVDLRQRTIRRQQQGWSEVFTISVEKRWEAIRSQVRVVLQVYSSNNALASCKSFVSNPSVNQPWISANIL
jgi:hypothetical protein